MRHELSGYEVAAVSVLQFWVVTVAAHIEKIHMAA